MRNQAPIGKPGRKKDSSNIYAYLENRTRNETLFTELRKEVLLGYWKHDGWQKVTLSSRSQLEKLMILHLCVVAYTRSAQNSSQAESGCPVAMSRRQARLQSITQPNLV